MLENKGKGGKLTGELSKEVMLALVEALPVDVTFVDNDDRIRYYSKSEIFKHKPSEIGLKVQDCHSEKSRKKVSQILDDFKNNKNDFVEYWIDKDNRKILIRYLAVRSKSGDYLGCLEVDQDITEIQKMKGEKRLLQNNAENV